MGISDILNKPTRGTPNWHVLLNENFEKLKAAAATIKSVHNGIEFQNPKNGTPFLRYNTDTNTVETSKNLEVSGVRFNNKADLTAADGVIVKSQLPDLSITSVTTVADKTERQALDVEEGDVAIQNSPQAVFIFTGGDATVDSNWKPIRIDILGAINGQQITPAQVGTSNNRTTIRGSSIKKNGSEVDDHTNLTNISSDDHHSKYTNSEAISAINADTDHGSTASHNYFTGSEARSAVASEPVGRPSYTSLSDAPSTSLGDIFHVGGDGLYVDTDATTVDNTDTPLQTHLDDTNNPHNTTVNVPVDSVNGKTGAVTIDTQTQSRRENSFYARNQSSGSTSGGGSSWNTQKYNDVKHNQITGATFDTSTYKLTLPAGEYYVESEQNPYDCNECSMRLYNDTTGTVEIRGNTGYSGANGSTAARVEGFLTLTQQSTLKLQLRTANTTSYIFGVSRNQNGMTTPIYAGKFYIEEL